jgi:hypothetical protein
MPKVTLLAEPGRNYCIPFGKSNYVFHGQTPLNVPTAVALFCKGKKDDRGRKMFEVAEIKNVVTPAPAVRDSFPDTPPSALIPQDPDESEQNVDEDVPYHQVLGNFTQLRLIEAELCH